MKGLCDEVPNDLAGQFLCYKELKKQLKGLMPRPQEEGEKETQGEPGEEEVPTIEPPSFNPSHEGEGKENEEGDKKEESTNLGQVARKAKVELTPEEKTFVAKLNLEIVKFNDYFIKREEELVIRVKDLEDLMEKVKDNTTKIPLRNAFVELHGEMVLLLHWCELNYIAVVKILKKHDKKTGLLLRSPYLASVVQQPFYSTMILKKLVRQVELILTAAYSSMGTSPEVLPQLVDDSDEEMASGLLKQTKVAISMWHALQKAKRKPEGEKAVEDKNEKGEHPTKKLKM